MGIFGWELLYMNLLSNCKMTRKIPRKFRKKNQHSQASGGTSSSNFWCIAVCGSSSAKRRTESSFFFEAKSRRMTWWRDLWLGLNSVIWHFVLWWWKTLFLEQHPSILFGNYYDSWSTTGDKWRLLDPSFPILMPTNGVHVICHFFLKCLDPIIPLELRGRKAKYTNQRCQHVKKKTTQGKPIQVSIP